MQIQVQETLTFEDICPVFSGLLAENGGWEKTKNMSFKSKDGDVKDLMVCKSCVVGEAHGN